MLSKNDIIELLNHKDEVVSESLSMYICRLHLFDDADINKEFIKYINNNDINYAEIKNVKLNNDIVQNLINLRNNKKDDFLKERIEDVLIHNYEFLDYDVNNYEDIFVGEEERLFIKKLKHYVKKDVYDLVRLFGNCVSNEIENGDEVLVSDIVRREAIGNAIIMKENGYDLLLESLRIITMGFDDLINDEEETDEIMIGEIMKFYISLFCKLNNDKAKGMILEFLFYNEAADDSYIDCLTYFSRINQKEAFDFYKQFLKDISRANIQGFFYEVCSFINLDEVDDFLKMEYKKAISDTQREYILSSLMERFCFDYVDEALNFIRKTGMEECEMLVSYLVPLLIIKDYNDDFSQKLIEFGKGL